MTCELCLRLAVWFVFWFLAYYALNCLLVACFPQGIYTSLPRFKVMLTDVESPEGDVFNQPRIFLLSSTAGSLQHVKAGSFRRPMRAGQADRHLEEVVHARHGQVQSSRAGRNSHEVA